ncbi:p24 complex component [Podochytrium sp. JEL0797]|nr:p24 complex component [Podochytrium sp. JEL0797]
MRQVLILLGALFQLALANNNFHITVPPHKKECFVEPLEIGDFFGVSYQVFGNGNLDVDFMITDKHDVIVKSQFRASTGSFSLDASKQGDYRYCISNIGTFGATEKAVSFSINGPDEQKKTNAKAASGDTAKTGEDWRRDCGSGY